MSSSDESTSATPPDEPAIEPAAEVKSEPAPEPSEAESEPIEAEPEPTKSSEPEPAAEPSADVTAEASKAEPAEPKIATNCFRCGKNFGASGSKAFKCVHCSEFVCATCSIKLTSSGNFLALTLVLGWTEPQILYAAVRATDSDRD